MKSNNSDNVGKLVLVRKTSVSLISFIFTRILMPGFMLLAGIGESASLHAQCSGCTYNAPAGGSNYNLNGNETLCITANTGDLNMNFNGSNNKICIASGAVWTQSNGLNFSGVTVDVYGTWNMSGGININSPSIINVHTGASFIISGSGFSNSLTINNAGTINFTNSGVISMNGAFVLNNSSTGTVSAMSTTKFFLGNGCTFNNDGTFNVANLENEEGILNNNTGASFTVSREFNNHGQFVNVGAFTLPCATLPGAAGLTTCYFRVGDKGAGKEFLNQSCMEIHGDVVWDGVTGNTGQIIIVDGDLTINKLSSGTNGSIVLTNGVSTINLSGAYAGTGLTICDQNTPGNGFDVVNNSPANNMYSVNCTAAATSCSGSAPSSCTLSNAGETLETCNNNGTTASGADDYITFSLNPTGTGLGATYSVTASGGATVTKAAGGAATGIAYGSATAFRLQNGSANGTSFTITVTDASGAACTTTTTVQQNACSISCAPLPCGGTNVVKN